MKIQHSRPTVALGLLLGGLFCQMATAQQDRLACDFSGTDPARHLPWTKTSLIEAGLTNQGWTMGPGISLVSTRDDRLAFSVKSSASLSTLADAKSRGEYLSFRIAPTTGPLNLGGCRISFTIWRESWHAPLQYALLSNVDGFSSPLFTSQLLDNADSATDSFSTVVPASGFDGLSGTVELRLYPFAARYSGHAASVTAFSIRTPAQIYSLSLAATTGGTAAANPLRSTFEAGETPRLTAQPAAGYRFLGWQGDLTGRGNPRSLAMNGPRSVTAQFALKASPRMDLGGNLEALVDWTTAWVFKDCFKLSRTWLTRDADGTMWDSGRTALTDSDGWPTTVPFTVGGSPPQILHTLLPLYDAGAYTVRFRGHGRVDLMGPGGAGRQSLTNPRGTLTRTLYYSPTLADNMLLLEVRESDASDPVRDIQVVAPGQDTDLLTQPFHPVFLASLAPYSGLRFMDWMNTNNSEVASWTQRTTGTSATQTRPQGAALELIAGLANATLKNPWICLPHQADDAYVRQTARLFRDTLDPSLELCVEYSNETWNGQFNQCDYVQSQGVALGLDPDRWQAGQKYVARRSSEIFSIFAEEFGAANRHRFVAVLATQAAGADGVTQSRVNAMNDPAINTAGQWPDALAIAPYFGVNYAPGDLTTLPDPAQLVTTVAQAQIATSQSWTTAHRSIADAQGWRLICYEGGQHFVGILGAENNAALTSILQQVNRDPRMADRYAEYLAMLRDAGVDLMMSFTHTGFWSPWGSWGVLEYQQQPASAAPKWRALESWATRTRAQGPSFALQSPAPGAAVVRGLCELHPGRVYQVQTSADLLQWTAVPGLENLRGDAVLRDLALPKGTGPRQFWRLRIDP